MFTKVLKHNKFIKAKIFTYLDSTIKQYANGSAKCNFNSHYTHAGSINLSKHT